MKNERTPRMARDGYLRGIGYTPDSKPSPWGFVIGLVIGVCVGVIL